MRDNALLDLAREVFLGVSDVETVESFVTEDSDGDPVWDVTVVLADEKALDNGRKLLTFRLETSKKLEADADYRFPLIRFILASEHERHAAA
jgi:hypothetical protein